MKTKWKIILGITALVVTGIAVVGSIQYSKRGIVSVQTGRTARQDLASLVTASGEIKPRNYYNVGNAGGIARIVEILVAEGAQVRKGQLLARLESVQPEAEVAAQKASVSSAEAESSASEASLRAADENLRTLQASIDRAKAELEKANINFSRTEKLWAEKLIAKSEYDQRKIEIDAYQAGLREAQARLTQATPSAPNSPPPSPPPSGEFLWPTLTLAARKTSFRGRKSFRRSTAW